MPSWKDEYLSALQERDRREKANQAFYDQCAFIIIPQHQNSSFILITFLDTKLADRTATLQGAPTRDASKEGPNTAPNPKDHKISREKRAPSSPTPSDATTKIRQDLSEAQRNRGLMETKLQTITEELNKLKIQTSLDSKRISELTKEKTVLSTKMRDRDEELKGKAKLLEVSNQCMHHSLHAWLTCLQDVHDETVSLTLQLNMAEEHSQKLQHENKELVDRWMARMGQEADAMNINSRFT